MKSKKGFVITAIILAAVTAASFMVWLIPQNIPARFVVSNPEDEINGIIEQQKIVLDTTTDEFDRMLNGEITPDNYISVAEISSTQINSLIIKVIQSDVPPPWQDSYAKLSEALRAHNTYIRETIVVAKKLKDGVVVDAGLEKEKLGGFLRQAQELLQSSNDSRPSS